MLDLFDLTTTDGQEAFADLMVRIRATASSTGAEAQTVARIVERVREEGDAAVVHYMREFADPSFDAQRMRVSEAELAQAETDLHPDMRAALEAAIANVQAYQEHVMPSGPEPVTVSGAEMGLRWSPVQSAGLAVPGGRADYPSSVIMLAVPALVARVPREALSVVVPPPTRSSGEPPGDVSALVLAACAILGIERVYRIGGAQAIAALALGTETVEAVDMIAGPGNVYVQLAKQQLAGRVGIDGFYGPSEILAVVDDSADPERVAADLIAQAEHDPGRCLLVGWDRSVVEAVIDAVARQVPERDRSPAIEKALAEESAAMLVADPDAAVAVATTVAAEHVSLAVADPKTWLDRIDHGGEFFLSDHTPVAAGDYYAGPSHCLPTGTTARFASGVSVYTFLRRSGWVHYREGMPE
ncbi:MAG: histidinol dehydrogenase, partial [Phycisphaeraceae bacterium]|nr:histidinol dehydrogenase [Phycisphaeraceae bacterium]